VDVRRFAPTATAEFLHGDYEIQDEGSQLAARLSGAAPGMQVGDLCAGAGGKTLALAALMGNRGQIFAHDIDARRLAKADERLRRAGVRNAQLRFPGPKALADLQGALDIAFVDAPCTGSGTWRRNPDAKWRLRPNALDQRRREQAEAPRLAAPLVKPGGRLVYVTCSVLLEENDDVVGAFLAASPGWIARPAGEVVRATLPDAAEALLGPVQVPDHGLQMTPRRTEVDGFYLSLLERVG
jgi:16S rRNA (cytosine967-C5)-methyltransferase